MSTDAAPRFTTDCRQCDRLAGYLDQVRVEFPTYHARPVATFGAAQPQLLIVGLAPGMHGANRSGRPFTGDHAGILLYETLYRFGFSNQAQSVSVNDGLQLIACRITNAVKCLPPQNKPRPDEVKRCNTYLKHEIAELPGRAAILALGGIAHQAVLRAQGLRLKDYAFGHGARHSLPAEYTLFDSYHCSRYNTQTKRLSTEMFRQVFAAISAYLKIG
jgi:uracil-DNA glycosylase family 4